MLVAVTACQLPLAWPPRSAVRAPPLPRQQRGGQHDQNMRFALVLASQCSLACKRHMLNLALFVELGH